ncbi:TetR/AcrR family transcriptional regulator [Streptomyces sp. PTM05]|uniref:TetR/AcrR family transcriptional regulator n=1 Tax=Streptantibioticus parmotrematis TaxID=2873249 RepID=A0ABS7QQM2_9ACTN|nr:TetR/AcrR family transcriptional regulator [Streptantibioticus parmotrematis]MBY8884670.1 TetR/AcrR family transcriptional regulator [Streptantibioticus parmotrematis]
MQVRAARTRQALIHAAAELIDDRGMKGTGLLDISRSAGVSKGALYFHFASKDDLIAAVRQEARGSVMALADECLDGRTSTLAGAALFTTAMSRHMREDPVLRAGLRLEAEGAVGERLGGDSLRQGWLTALRERLAADADAGRLRDDACARNTANLLAAVTVGLEALGREDETWWDPGVTTGIWELLLRLAGPGEAAEEDMAGILSELRAMAHGERGAVDPEDAREEVRDGAAEGESGCDADASGPDHPSDTAPGDVRHETLTAPGRPAPSGDEAGLRMPPAAPVPTMPAGGERVAALAGASSSSYGRD